MVRSNCSHDQKFGFRLLDSLRARVISAWLPDALQKTFDFVETSFPTGYEKNIKPAPNPYYMLNKYYGNLNIQEYRSLLRNERLFFIVDKPLTRILPELHEDNDEFVINNKIIPSNSNYQIKKKLLKKTLLQEERENKTNVINENFFT